MASMQFGVGAGVGRGSRPRASAARFDVREAAVWRVVLLLLLALVSSCSGKVKQAVPVAGKPLSRSLRLVTADGSAEVRTALPSGGAAAGEWSSMKRDVAAVGALEVRGHDDGAVIDVMDGERFIAKLWIRNDAAISLGEEEHKPGAAKPAKAGVRISLTKGEARLRSFDSASDMAVITREGPTPIGGRDVLLVHEPETTIVTDVAKSLEQGAWSLALETAKEAAGIGTLEARAIAETEKPASESASSDGKSMPAVPTPADPSTKLALQKLDVQAHRVGDYVETSVDHTFRNDGERRLEGTFRFPLPEGAILIGLSMDINGKMMDGELVESQKAQKIYQEIVDKMQDPALLQWEQGSIFKLRVFPIEPQSNKRVVLRFLSPLRRAASGFEWVYATAAPGMQQAIGSFRLQLDGKTIVDAKSFVPGHDIVVPMPASSVADVYRETRKDAVYTMVRVHPDWTKLSLPASTASKSRTMVVVMDTSRSTLEQRPLMLDSLRMLLSELRPDDRFRVVAADIDVHDHADTFVAPSPVAIDAAVDFIKAIEPDGASDLGAAIKRASQLSAEAKKANATTAVEVVYVGDGTPTWGETDGAALEKIAGETLSETPFHAFLLGNTGDGTIVRNIAAHLGGRSAHPRTAIEAKQLALAIGHGADVKRLSQATVVAGEKDEVYPSTERTLFEGDDIVTLVRSPIDAPAPKMVTLRGASGFSQVVPVVLPHEVPAIAKRWAVQHIMALEHMGDEKKADVIKASLDYQVMSKLTSFLVLESEEEYAKYDIARRSKIAAKEASAPKVTGADLESVGARTARMDPDHLQPGDPEVRIPAPADALSVVVVLPFGETKVARYEAANHVWTTRFLIDKDTPDGTYDLLVRITHHDGTLEVQKLEYVVDTQKPTVTLSLVKSKSLPGSYEVRASQVITAVEISSTIPIERRSGSIDDDRKKFASILTDVKRVEVRMPDGQQIVLNGIRLGEFRSPWTPKEALAADAKISVHVVAADRAMNQSVFDVTLEAK